MECSSLFPRPRGAWWWYQDARSRSVRYSTFASDETRREEETEVPRDTGRVSTTSRRSSKASRDARKGGGDIRHTTHNPFFQLFRNTGKAVYCLPFFRKDKASKVFLEPKDTTATPGSFPHEEEGKKRGNPYFCCFSYIRFIIPIGSNFLYDIYDRRVNKIVMPKIHCVIPIFPYYFLDFFRIYFFPNFW